MVDGPTEASELSHTEHNRSLVRSYIETVWVGRAEDQLDRFISGTCYVEHHPFGADGRPALRDRLLRSASEVRYERLHRVLAHGSFVLTVSEGLRGGRHTAFYDLHRVHDGQIVEHWDTIEAVPPPEEWRHANGKF